MRDILSTIRVPTLVMHRREDHFLNVEHSRYIAEQIPGAKYVELEGNENLLSSGDSESVIGEMEEFLTGTRHQREPDRVLATVMFTDIVGSTQRAAEMGDGAWRGVLERHDQLVRQEIERHRGRAVKSTGDGVLATFDGPARAIRAANSIDQARRAARHPDPRRPAHRGVRGDRRRRGRPRGSHRRAGDGRGRDRARWWFRAP